MSLIQFTNLSFSYEGTYHNIFEQVNLQIDTDWRLGLIGRNGRGKTTLLRLLCGDLIPEGRISKSVSCSYFPYQVRQPEASVLEVAMEASPDCAEWELVREFSLLELDEALLERRFSTLSHGEQAKVLLAALFLREDDYLLIDEPTNHLDLHGRTLVAQYLRKKSGFLLVSHDRSFLDGCINHVLSINRNGFTVMRGNYTTWQTEKDAEDQRELAENQRLKKEIKRLGATSTEKAIWSDRIERTINGSADKGYVSHKSAKMMKRAKILEARGQAALEEKEKLLKNIEQNERLELHPLSFPGKQLVQLEDVSIFYDGHPACEHVSFTVKPGELISLIGRNGSGKSSLLKLICGEAMEYQGCVQIAPSITISYVSQSTEGLSGSLTDYAREHRIDESLFKAILRKLSFERIQFEKNMEQFSAGQKKKVLLARSLCQQAHLYIWDEPLNYVDLLSRQQIEALLKEFELTLLFVEHDAAFCEEIASKKIEL